MRYSNVIRRYFFAIFTCVLSILLSLPEASAQPICERIVPQDISGCYNANKPFEGGDFCSSWPGESGIDDSHPLYHVSPSTSFEGECDTQRSDGKNVLKMKYAIVYDDAESGVGGNWAKWTMWVFPNSEEALADYGSLYDDCRAEDNHPRDAHITCLYGRYAADDPPVYRKCEWYDTGTICPQELCYTDFVIWDWNDWYRSCPSTAGPWDTVYIYFYENDEHPACDDEIMLFRVNLRETIGQVFEPTAIADYDGDDIDVRIWVQTELGEDVVFTDETLISKQTQVKLEHINELRYYINALRLMARLPKYNWQESIIRYKTVIDADHINELRNAIAEVYAVIGRSIAWSESIGSGKVVKIEHIQELREAVKALI